MNFNVWSKHLWICIHFMTLQLELDKKHNMYNESSYETIIHFLENMHTIMTCSYCKDKYILFLEKYDLKNYDGSLFEWSILLHNYVNHYLEKIEWTIEYAREYYINMLPK